MNARSQILSIMYKYFKARITMEKELNSIKSQLCQNPSFNALILFRTMDIHNHGRIGLNDILNFLLERGLNATLQEIEGVVHYFSKDSTVSLPSFIQGLIPKDMEFSAKGLSTPSECLIQLIFSIIDHNEELKTITRLTEEMEVQQFSECLGILKEFTPQELIRLFAEFNDQLDGVSFQIIFGSSKSLSMKSIKESFTWKVRERRAERLSESMLEKKKSLQRRTSLNSTLRFDQSMEMEGEESSVGRIMFCKEVDIDPLDREVYLEN